ncbi:reverse transcriptase domain-containing protein [Tanacetum coccineum]
MAPKRTSTSAAPPMTQAAIKKLVADSVSAALEEQDATMANTDNTNRNIRPREILLARKCSYKVFMSCQPFNFKGMEGAVGLIRWFERTELPIGIEEAYKITWSEFKKILIKKYCPRTEVKKMEDEFYNLTIKGNDLKTYVRRFQELAVLCPTMVPNSEKLMEVFIEGLPRSIEGNVTASKPQTLEEAITITQRLMDQNRRQETFRAYVVTPTENSRNCRNKGPATGSNLQPISITCHACGEKGHYKNQCPKANNNAHGRAYFGFDVVIGMDWLSKYHARNICDEKVVHIFIDSETLIFQVMKKKSDEKRLEDIPVVREFLEVFPEDLPGLPLVRQVEFQIDLIPGVTPVARAPYRLASSEMQELSDQLQELADRGEVWEQNRVRAGFGIGGRKVLYKLGCDRERLKMIKGMFEEDSITNVENTVFDLGVMEPLCFGFIDQRVLIGMITKFIKFIELNFPVITRNYRIDVACLRPSRLCARARSVDDMPFRTRACKSTPEGCFVSCAEAHRASSCLSDPGGTVFTYGSFQGSFQARF